MSFLPHTPILGKLELIEVYEYYDKPLLFACRNASDNIFITVLVDEGCIDAYDEEHEKDYEQWMYVCVSRTRFERIRSGAIDLHDTFVHAENGNVFMVTRTYDTFDEQVDVTLIASKSLTPDNLPMPGAYLQLETPTLSVLEIIPLEKANKPQICSNEI